METLPQVQGLFHKRGVKIKDTVRVELPEGNATGVLLGIDYNVIDGHSAVVDLGGPLLKRVHPTRVFAIH